MASNPALSANPTSVPTGSSSTITASFTLASGQTVTVALSINGGSVATVPVTVPAEAFPSVKIAGDPSIVATDYVLSTTAGVLSKTDASHFKLQL